MGEIAADALAFVEKSAMPSSLDCACSYPNLTFWWTKSQIAWTRPQPGGTLP